MAQLLLTHSATFHRAIRTRSSFPLTLHVGKFFLFFSMTFLIGLLSFFYLMKFTEIHTKGYELRKLEIARDKLMTSREAHATNIAKLKSLNAVREAQVTKQMVSVRSAIFLRKDGTFAMQTP